MFHPHWTVPSAYGLLPVTLYATDAVQLLTILMICSSKGPKSVCRDQSSGPKDTLCHLNPRTETSPIDHYDSAAGHLIS